ncbi:hypothetical protein TNCV_897481 [Trichonephila clavipes]|nr:hypothetical protein TNCV_897481 [Trichonephila clavipes]
MNAEDLHSMTLEILLLMEKEEVDDLLSRIVTGDEIWVSISPRNQSNRQWNVDTHPLPSRSQSQTNAVKAQGYCNSVLVPALCSSGGLNARRNNDQH